MKLAKLKSLILLFLNIFNISNDFRYLHINHHYQSRICHEEIKNSQNNLVFSSIQSNVSFFPQMRPEKKQIEFTDDEKLILGFLGNNKNPYTGGPIDLDYLKTNIGLSGKKWDKAMKNIALLGYTKIGVNENGVKIIELTNPK